MPIYCLFLIFIVILFLNGYFWLRSLPLDEAATGQDGRDRGGHRHSGPGGQRDVGDPRLGLRRRHPESRGHNPEQEVTYY